MNIAQIVILGAMALLVIIVTIAVVRDRQRGGTNYLWYDDTWLD